MHEFTAQWAHDYLDSLEPYAIVITHGDNDTFPLWYAQEIDGVRRDVTVAVSTYLDTDWYVRQMIRRPTGLYDAANGPAIYRPSMEEPTGPPLKMTLAKRDAIPDDIHIYYRRYFCQGAINLAIRPGYLERNQLAFVATTDKGCASGSVPFIVDRQRAWTSARSRSIVAGFRAEDRRPSDHRSAETPRIAGLFLDVDRTKELWDTVYRAPEALMKEGDWIDRPSFGIPYTYAFTGAVLAEAMIRQGDQKSANAIMDRVKRIVKAARIEGFPGA